MPEKLKRVTFLIDESTYEALRQQAFNQHRKMSEVIRDGLTTMLSTPVEQPKRGGNHHWPSKPVVGAAADTPYAPLPDESA